MNTAVLKVQMERGGAMRRKYRWEVYAEGCRFFAGSVKVKDNLLHAFQTDLFFSEDNKNVMVEEVTIPLKKVNFILKLEKEIEREDVKND